jgi:hypothetical protein
MKKVNIGHLKNQVAPSGAVAKAPTQWSIPVFIVGIIF